MWRLYESKINDLNKTPNYVYWVALSGLLVILLGSLLTTVGAITLGTALLLFANMLMVRWDRKVAKLDFPNTPLMYSERKLP